MELKNILTELGLEEKEARAYLALLSLGEASATKLAEKANLDRTLIYQLVNKLIERGLVSCAIKNNVRYFTASSPETLVENLKGKLEKLRQALPEFVSLTKTREEETKVELYRGKEGFKTILNDIIRAKKDYIAFGEEGRIQEVLPIDFERFLRETVRQKIHERVLVRADLKKIAWKTQNTKFKFIPKSYLSPSMTVVYGNKTVSLVWTKPYYAILTTNKEIADSFRSHFELLWKIAK